MNQKTNNTLVGLSAIPIWSLTPLLIVLIGPMSAFFMLGFRFLLSGIVLSFASIVRGEGFFSQFKHPIGVWILTLLGILLSQSVYIYALQHAPTAEANMINYVWPVYVILLGAWANKEKLYLRHYIGIVSGAIGCAVILLGDAGFAWKKEYALGYILAFLGGTFWAVYQVYMRKFYQNEKSSVQGGPFLIYSLISFGLYYLSGSPLVVLTPENWAYLLVFGLVPISYLFWEYGIKKGDYQALAFCAYFIPLLSAILIVLVTDVTFSWSLFLGGALIVAAPLIGREKIQTVQ
ncbi:MAG: hypothetical protein EYC62_05005 [Alphaproteobacteria bacterium]|nr:MAG: hypothetical protein EYC62_05005 [Alphaproteobacteria bacterium]